jgi:putative SOS response-associated peptidase YedK
MCGRMTMSRADLVAIADELEAAIDAPTAAAYRPRYNIAPTDRHLMLVGAGVIPTGGAGARAPQPAQGGRARRLVPARWGFTRGRVLINARAETVATRSAFREAFAGHRCVIPADGFYEWTGPKGHRRPIWFHRPDGRLLLLAGLWERTTDGPCFTVLTTAPSATVAPIHDRMPALLAPEDVASWLAAPEARLLQPAPDAWLVGQPASTRVNSVDNDDPACLIADPALAASEGAAMAPGAPAAAPPGPWQLSLFGR